ncbi:MAG TPA: hypothetical protein VEV65_08765, partial [Kineosporiaceae bacterium]|nr:hypothetical protein [Kineosporiaceae bacterium]
MTYRRSSLAVSPTVPRMTLACSVGRRTTSSPPGPSSPMGAAPVPLEALGQGGLLVVRRPTEQANVVLGTVGLTANDERRYVMSI